MQQKEVSFNTLSKADLDFIAGGQPKNSERIRKNGTLKLKKLDRMAPGTFNPVTWAFCFLGGHLNGSNAAERGQPYNPNAGNPDGRLNDMFYRAGYFEGYLGDY